MPLKITATQAQHLGQIIHELRPGWDPQGIMTQLGKAALNHKAGPTLVAAQRAAEDPNALTPAAILFDKYWTPEPATSHDTGTRHCIECWTVKSVDELTRTEHGWECGCKFLEGNTK